MRQFLEVNNELGDTGDVAKEVKRNYTNFVTSVQVVTAINSNRHIHCHFGATYSTCTYIIYCMYVCICM